jgi:hypothetical protein
MNGPEQDIRAGILNTLLTTPHRDLAKIWPIHQDRIAKDPRFYVRLAAWFHDHGDVRDHKEMFIIALSLSDFEGHRDVGLALLRQLVPKSPQGDENRDHSLSAPTRGGIGLVRQQCAYWAQGDQAALCAVARVSGRAGPEDPFRSRSPGGQPIARVP